MTNKASRDQIREAIQEALTILCDIARADLDSEELQNLPANLDRNLSSAVGGLVTARRIFDEEVIDRTQIFIREKNVYGNSTFYPACKESEFLAQLAGTKTLTLDKLRLIERRGIKISMSATESPSFDMKVSRMSTT